MRMRMRVILTRDSVLSPSAAGMMGGRATCRRYEISGYQNTHSHTNTSISKAPRADTQTHEYLWVPATRAYRTSWAVDTTSSPRQPPVRVTTEADQPSAGDASFATVHTSSPHSNQRQRSNTTRGGCNIFRMIPHAPRGSRTFCPAAGAGAAGAAAGVGCGAGAAAGAAAGASAGASFFGSALGAASGFGAVAFWVGCRNKGRTAGEGQKENLNIGRQ